MNLLPIVRSAVVAAALAASAGASASIVNVTYTGKVGMGIDLTGMFGGVPLNGQAYTLVYTIDTSTPGALHASSATSESVSGGGATSPVRAAITINGITWQITGGQDSSASVTDAVHASGQPYAGVFDRLEQQVNDYAYVPGDFYHKYSASTSVLSYAQDFVHGADLGGTLSYPGTTGTDSIYSLVEMSDFDYRANRQVNYAWLNLNIDSALVQAVADGGASVPEPASALLLLGGAAALARVRRRAG